MISLKALSGRALSRAGRCTGCCLEELLLFMCCVMSRNFWKMSRTSAEMHWADKCCSCRRCSSRGKTSMGMIAFTVGGSCQNRKTVLTLLRFGTTALEIQYIPDIQKVSVAYATNDGKREYQCVIQRKFARLHHSSGMVHEKRTATCREFLAWFTRRTYNPSLRFRSRAAAYPPLFTPMP